MDNTGTNYVDLYIRNDNGHNFSAVQAETFDNAELILQRLCFTYYPFILFMALVTDILFAAGALTQKVLMSHVKLIRCDWFYWITRSSAVTYLCRISGQGICALNWIDAIQQNLDFFGAKKLAEGSYGEVYIAKLNNEKVVLKVIPFRETDTSLENYPLVNDEEMESANTVLTEVMVSKALSNLSNGTKNRAPSFVTLRKTFVFKGYYPKELLSAWNTYHINVGSESSSPTEYDSADRHYIVMAFEFGGVELDSYEVRSVGKAMSILLQVALALTVAELELEFEHRDLHWGNILICEENVPEFIEYKIEGKEVRVRSHGVKVVIIDFTNSRIKKNRTVIHKDLSQDKLLFEGEGDPQYQVYPSDNWDLYMPETNAMWLDYLVDKLFNGVEGKLSKISENQRDETVKKLAFTRNCSSASDFVRRSRLMFSAFYDNEIKQPSN